MSGGSILALTVVQMVVAAVPAIAAVLLAIRRGVREVPILLALALAASGAAAMLTFWAYYAGQGIGSACAYATFFGSVGAIVWSWPVVGAQRQLLRRLAVPLGLWALASLFVVFFGFLHGGTEAAIQTASDAFLHQPRPVRQRQLDSARSSRTGCSPATRGSPPLFLAGLAVQRQAAAAGRLRADAARCSAGTRSTHALRDARRAVCSSSGWSGSWALLERRPSLEADPRRWQWSPTVVSDVAIDQQLLRLAEAARCRLRPRRHRAGRGPRGSSAAQPSRWTMVVLGVLAGLAFLSHGDQHLRPGPSARRSRSGAASPPWRWLGLGAAAAAARRPALERLPALRRSAGQPPPQVVPGAEPWRSTAAAPSRRSATNTPRPGSAARSRTSSTTSPTMLGADAGDRRAAAGRNALRRRRRRERRRAQRPRRRPLRRLRRRKCARCVTGTCSGRSACCCWRCR